MSQVLAHRIHQLLRRRLGDVGIAPDLHNDDQAIAQICQELQIGRDQVRQELDQMRSQVAARIVGRDRASTPADFLAQKPAAPRPMPPPGLPLDAEPDEPDARRKKPTRSIADLGSG